MKLLTLDPSSVCVGWALMGGYCQAEEFGHITADRKKPAAKRIHGITVSVTELIQRSKPNVILIEITSGKAARRIAKASGGAGLGVYGMAVGAVLAAAWLAEGNHDVISVEENKWTRGQPKATRLDTLAVQMPDYAKARGDDPGGDAGDAICLGNWLFDLINMRGTDSIDVVGGHIHRWDN